MADRRRVPRARDVAGRAPRPVVPAVEAEPVTTDAFMREAMAADLVEQIGVAANLPDEATGLPRGRSACRDCGRTVEAGTGGVVGGRPRMVARLDWTPAMGGRQWVPVGGGEGPAWRRCDTCIQVAGLSTPLERASALYGVWLTEARPVDPGDRALTMLATDLGEGPRPYWRSRGAKPADSGSRQPWWHLRKARARVFARLAEITLDLATGWVSEDGRPCGFCGCSHSDGWETLAVPLDVRTPPRVPVCGACAGLHDRASRGWGSLEWELARVMPKAPWRCQVRPYGPLEDGQQIEPWAFWDALPEPAPPTVEELRREIDVLKAAR